MPEGDSIAINAVRLRPVLVDQEIVSVYGTAPSLRSNSQRVAGRRVSEIRTVGKNLVVDLDNGYSILVHLGMSGSWRILDRSRAVPGEARLALTTADAHAVCLAAPTVEVDRSRRIDDRLRRLGPDVLSPEFEPEDFVVRVRARGSVPIGEALLDQRVVAGIGNVYKSELLFKAQIHPETRVGDLADGKLAEIGAMAKKLLAANVRRGPRSTTGERARGREMWVYGRAGKPCRSCSTPIRSAHLGERVTYWCPACQPSVDH